MVDRDRPAYHFLPPKNWMNDPKPFFWNGEYHVFFQYNPHEPVARLIHWGHAVSRDLVHWEMLPIALAPTPGGPDKDGCWTGCCVEKDGLFHILYTGVHPQVQCLATSDDLITWEKYPGNPVISTRPEGFGDCWRDPCAWREGDRWLMLLGSEIKDVGGAALLYRSSDLIRWEYLHPLCVGDKDVFMFECPDFFPLGDRHVLLASCGATHWHTGRYNEHKFTMGTHGIVDGGNFYAAKTLLDDKGRRILWGWITEGRSQEEQVAAGWSGVLSLPRVVSILPDGTLGFSPAPELSALRGRRLDKAEGDALEIIARFKPNSGRVGINIGRIEIYTDLDEKQLVAGQARTPFDVRPDEEIELHVFLDHSVIEVFANGRACVTARAYSNAGDIGLIGEPEQLDIWEVRL